MADIKSLNGYNLKDAQARTDLGTHAADTSKHVTAAEKAVWDAKQGPITDLDDIRAGAALGATALQEHQSLSAYRTAAAQDTIDNGIQGQIDAIVSKSDVVDIVNTYAELQAYDTTKLHSNDVVKVLSDSTHADGRSYYRWVVTGTSGAWSYIGTESVGYTKAETDVLLNAKQNAIADLETIRNGATGNVKHTSQTLTVAQQMQARANQGLYYSEYEATAEPIEWDGSTDGRTSFTVSAAGTNTIFYKVSDAVLHKSDVVGGTYQQSFGGHSMTLDITDENVNDSGGLTLFFSYVSANAGVYYGGAYDVPEDGTYYGVPAGTGIPDDLVARLEFPAEETVHSIEAKYIPAEVKLPSVSEADDGKILQVVDGAWSAVVIGNAEEASY